MTVSLRSYPFLADVIWMVSLFLFFSTKCLSRAMGWFQGMLDETSDSYSSKSFLSFPADLTINIRCSKTESRWLFCPSLFCSYLCTIIHTSGSQLSFLEKCYAQNSAISVNSFNYLRTTNLVLKVLANKEKVEITILNCHFYVFVDFILLFFSKCTICIELFQ